MNPRHFVVDNAHVDELAHRFVVLRRAAQSAFSEGGASPHFMESAKVMSMTYCELVTAMGLSQGYAVSADGKRARLIRVERSMGRTILTFPPALTPSCTGLNPVSPEAYEGMRQEALSAMGASSQALAAS